MQKIGDHAVVLGASMGGLLAARVLADAYERVTVVDRDVLPEAGVPRKGVPQGRHAHALLPSGAQVLGDLFAGLLAGLAAAGVPVIDDFREMWFSVGGHLLCQDGKPDTPAYLASRPYLEGKVRGRVRALPNVRIKDRCEAAGLVTTRARDRVTGHVDIGCSDRARVAARHEAAGARVRAATASFLSRRRRSISMTRSARSA